MESEKLSTERETLPQQWRSCKLMIDPALTKGLYKVFRFDGQYFNIPVEDLGLFPVDTARDPRICRLWSKSNKTDLVVPKFKVDEWYIGPVPPKEVTFSRLNDNIREAFLTNMCKEYGSIEEVEIFYNPNNKKHLGIAKVVFDTVRAAKDAVQHLHQTSVMGNIIHVEIDPKGENRARYLQLLLRGLYTPWTLPVGSNERALQSLIDSLVGCSDRQQQQGSVFSPTSIATPLSLDTAYSSIWQDTPCSFGLTPHSQGTPRTPCLSATPLSQDSCYSSLQATPVLQGEPSMHIVHKPLRRELCSRKPARYHRGFLEASDVSLHWKHCQPKPPHPLSNQIQTSSQQHALCDHNAQSSTHSNKETSHDLASPCQESSDMITATSKGLPLDCNSFSILSINFSAKQQTAAGSPSSEHECVTLFSPSAVNCSPSSPQPEVESLDSRIESLLISSQGAEPLYFNRKILEADGHSQDSPASPCSANNSPFSEDSLVCTTTSCGSLTARCQRTCNELVDADPTLLIENEEDETTQAVSFLTRNCQSPSLSDFTDVERVGHADYESAAKTSISYSKEPYTTNEDKEHSNNKESGAPTQSEDTSFSQALTFSSLSHTTPHLTPQAPPPLAAGCSQPSVTPFPFPPPPFPPSIPPLPPRLPNGIIPIPPPGWIPPLGHHTHIPIPPPPIPPPPSIPPPPAFLRPPPPLIVHPSVPPPVHTYPTPMQPSGPLDKENSLRQVSAPAPQPPWHAPLFPRFNPFVPPPNYPLTLENPHKVTVDKVLEVLMDELKSIIRKDITRRMIEGVAFKAFEDWWDSQEKKTKIQACPSKSGTSSMAEKNKLINPLIHVSGHAKKPPLPSFKVKRKTAGDPAPEEIENVIHTSHEKSDRKQGDEIETPASERPKRRHARPHELDSDDEDDEGKEDTTLVDNEIIPDKAETLTTDNIAPQTLCDRDDCDYGDGSDYPEEEKNKAQRRTESEDATTTDGAQCSDIESSSSEESEYSSDFNSSYSFFSESCEGSSRFNLCTDNEAIEEDTDDSKSDDCIVISSDEESMEYERPLNLSAPLTPGAQLDLALQEWSDPFHNVETEENPYTSHQRDICDIEAMMELQNGEPQDVQLPSPIRLPVEPDVDVMMDIPEWIVECTGNVENLRPLTPTGCLVDCDPDLLIKNKLTSPAVVEVERPQTPGKDIVAELEIEDSDESVEVSSLSPASPEFAVAPSDVPADSYALYQEMPNTPGTEERSEWIEYSSVRTPPTPGRETAMSEGSPPPIPALSNNPYRTAPKTPGRDIILPRRAIIHLRKSQMVTATPHLLYGDSLRCSPITVSSPCSLSDSSSDTADERSVWISSGGRTKPLQGLENVPGLLDEETSLLRRKHWRRLKHRRRTQHRKRSLKRITGSLSSPSRPCGWRSLGDERRILHSVWKEGLDEEDARLLHSTYDRLQEQDNGLGWLSDTLWIPHPHILFNIPTEKSEEDKSWLPSHRTGSARSEGFYKISRKDKLKYFNNSKLATELPSTSTQGMCIPAQQPISLRAGSDFRSEQRRLLSSFSCDSDLVKFNQLKFRKKRIRFSRSHIHEWGLFAMEPIAADEMVIEYVGQIIRQVIADMREQKYEEEGIGSSYLFRIDQDTIIDATKFGNLARFINHSCNPNCYAKIITVESQKKIVIYSRQPISVNEEITYDYKFPIEETKIPCLCGADSCRGSLN
ncbi:hypothetical protein Q5P01_014757 [Channa striata]|uniref:[histone H3]-lysine(4) N-trimethyltransferase n=1 Tax=Channa striata TaxID=64152 RepID=A0AA88SFK3_CHASR|nr:hypothetical protein Q5P01_014757 [Channa striata]